MSMIDINWFRIRLWPDFIHNLSLLNSLSRFLSFPVFSIFKKRQPLMNLIVKKYDNHFDTLYILKTFTKLFQNMNLSSDLPLLFNKSFYKFLLNLQKKVNIFVLYKYLIQYFSIMKVSYKYFYINFFYKGVHKMFFSTKKNVFIKTYYINFYNVLIKKYIIFRYLFVLYKKIFFSKYSGLLNKIKKIKMFKHSYIFLFCFLLKIYNIYIFIYKIFLKCSIKIFKYLGNLTKISWSNYYFNNTFYALDIAIRKLLTFKVNSYVSTEMLLREKERVNLSCLIFNKYSFFIGHLFFSSKIDKKIFSANSKNTFLSWSLIKNSTFFLNLFYKNLI